jgi:plastocyanin
VRLASAVSGLLLMGGTLGATAAPAVAWSPKTAGGPAAHGTTSALAGPANRGGWRDWNWSDPLKDKKGRNHVVTIPEEDRFTPFALTIHVGDSVTWRNEDTDDHTVVTDNAFTTTDNRGVNHLIPGTEANHGRPGIFTLTFRRAGAFVYYCRFHARLDQFDQPVAPGPEGGIQDPNGNFGTPMNGLITVLPNDGDWDWDE